MKSILLTSFAVLTIFIAQAQPSHSAWNALLQKYVSDAGNVNYAGIKSNKAALDKYLNTLKNAHPTDSWSKNEKMAYWINAYNAFTIALIIDHYPTSSINNIKKDGKKPWDIPFIKIGSKTYTLNNIEHDILRKKYPDPRIHFAVNCASFSCPPLMNSAFTSSNLNAKMDLLAKKFINDKSRNKISAQNPQVSQIFTWFKDDFTKKGSLIAFLNQYSTTKIAANAKISYLDYNWNLNK